MNSRIVRKSRIVPLFLNLPSSGTSGKEVDLVCESRDGRLVGIEVKGKASVKSEDFKGLRSLEADAGKAFLRGILLYNGTQTVQFSDTMAAVPIPALWRV